MCLRPGLFINLAHSGIIRNRPPRINLSSRGNLDREGSAQSLYVSANLLRSKWLIEAKGFEQTNLEQPFSRASARASVSRLR